MRAGLPCRADVHRADVRRADVRPADPRRSTFARCVTRGAPHMVLLLLMLCVLAVVTGCGNDGGGDSGNDSSQNQSNEHGSNQACGGHDNQCVSGTLIMSVPPGTPSVTPEDTPSPADTAPEDPSPPAATSPTPAQEDGNRSPLDGAPRTVLQGPGPGSLRIALLDVPAPQPRWSTLGIGAAELRAAGVDGVLFRLPAPVPATVTVDTSAAPDDVEYVFFDAAGQHLGTQSAAACAVQCPWLTQNAVTVPQYMHVLVTDAGRSGSWPPGQRYTYVPVAG